MSLEYRLSILANLALLGAAVLLIREGNRAASHIAGVTAPPTRSAPSKLPVASRPTAARPEETADVFARLEKAGVSRIVLADIMRNDHRRRWGKRVRELENRFAPKQPPQREYVTLRRLEEEDEDRELKQTLGEEGYAAWDKEQTLRKVNFEEVPMKPEESDRVYQLDKQLDDKLREMRLAMEYGDADVADMSTLQMKAQDEYEKALENLLGKERYDKLKGYSFPVVEGHAEFNELNPSPDQVSALQSAVSGYQAAEAELSKRIADKPMDAAAIAAELKTMNEAQEQSMRKAIGADAYEALRREHDETYQALTQYAQAWHLQDNEIEPVYQKLKAYEDNVEWLRKAAQMTELAGQTADWSAVKATIERSRQATQSELEALVGPDRARAIARNGLLSPVGRDRNAPHGGGS